MNKHLKKRENVGFFKEMKIDSYLTVRNYHLLSNILPKEYNFTIEKEQLDACPIQEHYLTALLVNKDYAEKGYRFNFDCCKLDTANYLIEEKGENRIHNKR